MYCRPGVAVQLPLQRSAGALRRRALPDVRVLFVAVVVEDAVERLDARRAEGRLFGLGLARDAVRAEQGAGGNPSAHAPCGEDGRDECANDAR